MPDASGKTEGSPRDSVFVGREGALKKLHSLFREGARVISITGPEGTGKSRLVQQFLALYARDLSRGGSSPVLCDLTDTGTVDEVIERVGQRVGAELPADAADDAPDLLGELLASRGQLVLVLDSVDRATRAVAELVQRWLLLAPLARFVVTARDAVGVPDEVRLKLGPLRVPPSAIDDADALLGFESMKLFLERARQAARGYTLEAKDAPVVAEIVRRLNGLPLAIELAAARVSAYSPTELLERLPSRVDLLKKRPVSSSQGERQPSSVSVRAKRRRDSLTSTIEWSWRLLKPWEQSALAQCAVFRGGFTLEAAKEVVDLSDHAGAPPVKEALASLCAKSLLRVGEVRDSGERRYVHYASVRDFAEDWLERGNGALRTRNRHAMYYLELGRELAEGVDGHGGLEKRRRLERETENLLAVVRGALARDPVTILSVAWALEGMLALEPVLSTRGPFSVHLSLLDAALEPAELVGVSPELRGRALESRGRLLRARGQLDQSLDDLEDCLKRAREADDRLLEGRALANIGTHYLLMGDVDEAERRYLGALDLLRSVGARPIEARARYFFGRLRQRLGKTKEALADYEAALEALRDAGDRRYEGIVLGDIASLLAGEGGLERATRLYERALHIHREIGNRRFEGATLRELGSLRLEAGRLKDARRLLEKSVDLLREVFDRSGEARAHARLGDLFVEDGRLDEARAQYERAVTLQASSADRARRALLLARAAALDAVAGAQEVSRATLEEAKQLATDEDRAVVETLMLYEDLIESALGRPDPDEADETTAPDLPQRARLRPSPHLRSELRAARKVAHLLRAR